MFDRVCPECGLDRLVSLETFDQVLRGGEKCRDVDDQLQKWLKKKQEEAE